ncbi:DUF2570 domain-containing protein [Citrobacter werkmanii]|uniref:DUF2570 domain-containing protein n=1 Tax=Citrobacter werkmanii TaxID=67827 RepID=UPI001D0BC5D3|nr:DUF2570 domain-containing protein [Citrobacter werkmanii]MBY6247571.1 DUF2570 domain-containing protein [Citrobacter werkmanii]MBY6253502.1 DUF2570 domain-containing protein [Citrobacter werkmanii]
MLKKFPLGEVITIAAIVIVILLTMKLVSDNRQLGQDNGRLSEQIKDVSSKNDALASSLDSLVDQVAEMNKIVATEAKRRAAAEMKSQRLQEEVKSALKENKCAIELIPADGVIGVRKAADSARGHKGTNPSDTGKSSD